MQIVRGWTPAVIAVRSMVVLTLIAMYAVVRAYQENNTVPFEQRQEEKRLVDVLPDSISTQLVMVVVGSSRCGASQGNALAKAIRMVRDSARLMAEEQSVPFVTIGVALDYWPEEGLRWLRGIGEFDEVLSGQKWLGEGAFQFVWGVQGAPTVVPQIILETRTIERRKFQLRVINRSELARMVGPVDILEAHGLNSLRRTLFSERTGSTP